MLKVSENLKQLMLDEEKIAAKMTDDTVTVRQGMTVRQAMKELISQAATNSNVSLIYVLDENLRPVGTVELAKLIRARQETPLAAFTDAVGAVLCADENVEDCMERIRECDADSLPVVDGDGCLCGIVTSRQMTEITDEEIGEDYAKLAALSEEEDLGEPVKKSIAKRLPWLTVLLFLGLAVSAVVGLFENVVSSLTVIVSFQSLILGMAGNVGTQSLAVTVRVLADENIVSTQKLKLLLKETKIALINGIIMGALSFCTVISYLILKGESGAVAVSVGVCTALALIISLLLSGIFGTAIPMVFKKIGIDPAVASGPLITTINDLVAVISYYGLAMLFISGL